MPCEPLPIVSELAIRGVRREAPDDLGGTGLDVTGVRLRFELENEFELERRLGDGAIEGGFARDALRLDEIRKLE